MSPAEIARRYREGASILDIAREAKRATTTIRGHLSRQGVEIRRPGRPMLPDPRGWVAQYEAGLSMREIGSKSGMSIGSVWSYLLMRDVKMREPGTYFTFDASDWPERYAAGETAAEIAAEVGCHPSTVNLRLHASGVTLRPRGRRTRS